jgi:transcriptional regulator with XRE-family HTH domain
MDSEAANSPQPLTLGTYIRHVREQKGLSLRQLAKLLGRNPGYVKRIEADFYKRPGLDVLQDIAKALGVEFERLVALTGHQLPEDLPALADYLARKYDVDTATARTLADQFTDILKQHDIQPKPNEEQDREQQT